MTDEASTAPDREAHPGEPSSGRDDGGSSGRGVLPPPLPPAGPSAGPPSPGPPPHWPQVAQDPPLPPPPPAPWSDLLLRPGRFFATRLESLPRGLVFLAAVLGGVAGVIDRMAITALREGDHASLDSWPAFWRAVAIATPLTALFAYWVRGLLYRLRLWLAGARRSDGVLSRRLPAVASLLLAVPLVVGTIVDTFEHETPRAADAAPLDEMDFVLFAAIAWSVVASWRGAIAVFQPVRWRAAILFLVLPLAFYASLIGLVAFAASVGPDVDPPDLVAPSRLDAGPFEAEHPANWIADTTESDRPWPTVLVAASADASVRVDVVASEPTVEEEIVLAIERFRENAFVIGDEPDSTFDRWGAWNGRGERRAVTFEGERYDWRLFVSELSSGRSLLVSEVVPEEQVDLLGPGFRLVEATLRLDEAPVAPDLSRPRTWSRGFLSLPHPANWQAHESSTSTEMHPMVTLIGPSGHVQVMVYRRRQPLEDELTATLEEFEEEGAPTSSEPVTRWGEFEGQGFDAVLQKDGGRAMRLFTFVTFLPGTRVLEVRALHAVSERASVDAVLDLVGRDLDVGHVR